MIITVSFSRKTTITLPFFHICFLQARKKIVRFYKHWNIKAKVYIRWKIDKFLKSKSRLRVDIVLYHPKYVALKRNQYFLFWRKIKKMAITKHCYSQGKKEIGKKNRICFLGSCTRTRLWHLETDNTTKNFKLRCLERSKHLCMLGAQVKLYILM